MKPLLIGLTLLAGSTGATLAQDSSAPSADATRADEIRELKAELARISARLDALEKSDSAAQKTLLSPAPPAISPALTSTSAPPALTSDDAQTISFLHSTTIGLAVDGYYGYNFNQPIGRVNLLRAYSVTSNSFSVSQANLVIEHLPTPQERAGGRIDLQFGQATETLGGSSVNEQRPQVWRNLFQVYGSYLAPVGSGLRLDFGKFASSLGVEGNYNKDQVAYTRSYLFNYLPYYHTGLRASYDLTPKASFTYWLVNGAQQAEDFNGWKSQGFIFTLKPASTMSWNVNYYFGQEQRDVLPTPNPGLPTAPTQPGLPTANIVPAPNGREHIFDTYATWTPTSKLTLIGEADYVLNRTFRQSAPSKVAAGALYVKYALPRDWNLAARTEYFDDRSGLFSGVPQSLKEVTFVADHLVAPGFIARAEYRRDFSNRRFFLTDAAQLLSPSQTTATLGLIYWWGTKQGSW